MDRLRAFEVFVQVAECGSLAEAGRQLDLPRGMVSKHLQQLEDLYGTRLLNRTTRRVSLTEAGARLHKHCRVILSSVQETQQDLDEQRGEPRGTLRIAAPLAFTDLHLGAILERFVTRYPDVKLDLECSEQFADIVLSGFDVGVRIAELPPSSLVARPLAPSPLALCASPTYLARNGEPRSLDDLRHHACLGYAHPSTGQHWDLTSAAGPLRLPIVSRHRTNSNHTLRELALHGHGIGQLPMYLVACDIAAGRLVSVLDTHRDTSRNVYVVYPHRRHLPAKVRALVDFLVEVFAGGAPWNAT